MKLLTNNPKKIIGLEGYGLEVVQRVSIEIPATRRNRAYLLTKRDKFGHLLTLGTPVRPAATKAAGAKAGARARRTGAEAGTKTRTTRRRASAPAQERNKR
jgi:3,4-dihydroxy 2-butanone 4-phosphate synthase/GTP cyclohydrolase II